MGAYISIDLKSFYASAEAADRHLDPLTTNLVVADPSRTEKTICLAVSPALKAYGIPGRARLFEVIQRVNEVNALRLQTAVRLKKAVIGKDGKPDFSGESFDSPALEADPSLKLGFIIAPPRMARYMEVSAKIYAIYRKYVAEDDIFLYSIDEVFLDAQPYLETYHMSAHDLAKSMIREVLYETGITATAGIGTNLYLAKLAMDIVAKRVPPDADGVRIAELDEESFRYLLWNHRPLTDFWRTGPGTAAKLEKHGIMTMGDLARFSLQDEDWFYKHFGVDAEILVDHAWGLEPVNIHHVKQYKPSSNSITEGQVLHSPYTNEMAKVIVREMGEALAYNLMSKNLVTDSLNLMIGYDRESVDNGSYRGEVVRDHYGRSVPKAANGTTRLAQPTNLSSQLITALLELYERIIDPAVLVRRITINANRVVPDEGIVQMDFFTDTGKIEKEKKLQETMLAIRNKYSKNAILRGTNFLDGATMRERNEQVGGHKAQ